MKYQFTKEQVQEAVNNSLSIAQVCRELGIRPIGGNYKTINSKLKLFEIDISHFTGAAWNVGLRYRPVRKLIPMEEILIVDSTYTNTGSLKKRLYKEGLKEKKCEICDITHWMDNPITLELDHINGSNTDNRLENLRILCPNCHSQTTSFRGRNQNRSAISEKREVEYRKFKETPAEMRGNLEPSLNEEGAETLHGTSKFRKPIEQVVCPICQELFNKRKKQKYCSYECKNVAASIKIPTYQDLITAFEVHKNFLQVGKHFNVSDNSVRKWCTRYGILDMMKKKSSARTE